jgi:hypothetical protein
MSQQFIRAAASVGALVSSTVALAGRDVPVQVIVDMDLLTSGYQSSITVSPCADTVEAAVYLVDPLGSRSIWSIGFLGGIDRGIAFGHVPSAANTGAVTAINARAAQPANPDNTGFIEPEFMMIESFAGPELQYLEFGNAGGPALISSAPTKPLFTITVSLGAPAPGDVFGFHLLDLVSASFGAGALSTSGGLNSLDTGGDAAPDGTVTLYGVDVDPAVSVPPAAYLVDYIDGPPPPEGGPATIVVAAPTGDLNGDCAVDGADLGELLLAWGPCAGCERVPCPADLHHDCQIDGADLGILLLAWRQ